MATSRRCSLPQMFPRAPTSSCIGGTKLLWPCARAARGGLVSSRQTLSRRSSVAELWPNTRSEERLVGQQCVRTCRYRWSPDKNQNKKQETRTDEYGKHK